MLIFRPVILGRGSKFDEFDKFVLRACIHLIGCSWVCSGHMFACRFPDKSIAVKGGLKYSTTIFPHHTSQITPPGLTCLKERELVF